MAESTAYTRALEAVAALANLVALAAVIRIVVEIGAGPVAQVLRWLAPAGTRSRRPPRRTQAYRRVLHVAAAALSGVSNGGRRRAAACRRHRPARGPSGPPPGPAAAAVSRHRAARAATAAAAPLARRFQPPAPPHRRARRLRRRPGIDALTADARLLRYRSCHSYRSEPRRARGPRTALARGESSGIVGQLPATTPAAGSLTTDDAEVVQPA